MRRFLLPLALIMELVLGKTPHFGHNNLVICDVTSRLAESLLALLQDAGIQGATLLKQPLV